MPERLPPLVSVTSAFRGPTEDAVVDAEVVEAEILEERAPAAAPGDVAPG